MCDTELSYKLRRIHQITAAAAKAAAGAGNIVHCVVVVAVVIAVVVVVVVAVVVAIDGNLWNYKSCHGSHKFDRRESELITKIMHIAVILLAVLCSWRDFWCSLAV